MQSPRADRPRAPEATCGVRTYRPDELIGRASSEWLTRSAAINKAGVDASKLDALTDYQTSPLFSDSERAALAFATELTKDRHVSPDTFTELARHYSERGICDIVFIVASEHLYNIGLNIGSAGMRETSMVG